MKLEGSLLHNFIPLEWWAFCFLKCPFFLCDTQWVYVGYHYITRIFFFPPCVLFSIKHAALVITFNLTHYLTLRVCTCVSTFNSPPNHRLGGKVMLSILLILLGCSKTRKEKENVFIAPTSFLVCFPPLSLHVSFYFYLASYNFL
jgi:hypothetical protein